jgi:class 3 adenylate cyclase/tetratricopeptide (TPR) repeat protein
MTSGEERKVVTVVFADLAGSTELAQRHDPEQLRQLLSAFFEEMSQQIRSFGGTVEKYAGDAIMAVFGVPRVHEDDAERAVRAALAMRESLVQLNPLFEQEYGARLELRVGIATGEVVAATDDRREMLVTGETANLAARLQSAGSGIVVSEATHRLLARLLDSRRLEPLALKGFSQPVTAYEVSGLRTLDAAPRGIPGLSSPVVGRDVEAATLRQTVEELRRGRGQIVFLVGEAGIGKSRLKIDLREALPEGVRWLEGRCQAYTQSTSYAPIAQLLRALLGLGSSDTQAVARTRLRAGLRSLVGERYDEVQPTIAHLLGIELEAGRHSERQIDPQALKSQIVLALRALLEGLTARGPAVLAVEDIHWADPATIELLVLLTELTDHLPLMILVTSRPDPEGSAWDLRFHAQRNFPHRLTEILLPTLRPEDTAQLVRNLLHVAELPEDLKGRIMERAEGNPFFLEEILRSLIDEGILQREGNRWVAGRRLERLAMPDTLRGVIGARIDRLPPDVKATLQHAAVVGRFFSRRALAALAERGQDMDRAIAHLLRAELVREFSRLPEPEYIFKHALTQDAAYASILAERRRLLHERVAADIEETVGDRPGEHAAVLADHWLRADRVENALRWTLRAAERARGLYARPEAIAHYWQALELLRRLPETPERSLTHAETVLDLMFIPGWVRDAADREAGLDHLNQGIREAIALGAVVTQAKLESQKGIFELDEGLLLEAMAHAESSDDPTARALAAVNYGEYMAMHGRYESGLPYIAKAIEMLGAAGDVHEQAMWMAGPGRCYSARAGSLVDALDYAARARRVAEDLGDARLRAWGGMEAEPYLYQGPWDDLVRVAEPALTVAWEIGEWTPICFVSAWLGIAYIRVDRVEDARRIIERAVRESRARTYTPFQVTYLHIAQAQLHLKQGRKDEALAAATTALDFAQKSGFGLEEGAARRVLAQAHDAAGDMERAEREFGASLDILEDIQSRPELAQTLLAYGRFRLRGDRENGRRLIERALGIFEEIGATGWIAETRAAMGQP